MNMNYDQSVTCSSTPCITSCSHRSRGRWCCVPFFSCTTSPSAVSSSPWSCNTRTLVHTWMRKLALKEYQASDCSHLYVETLGRRYVRGEVRAHAPHVAGQQLAVAREHLQLGLAGVQLHLGPIHCVQNLVLEC